MVAPATPAVLHFLTPGNPAYAMLKVGAIGGIFALRFALVRRNRHSEQPEAPTPAGVVPERREPHPVSKKKKKRRKRR